MTILGILAIWLLWTTVERWVDADRWVWYLIVACLGIAWQIPTDRDHWWYGVGIGGGVVALSLVTDLVLVLTDWCRVTVLKHQRH